MANKVTKMDNFNAIVEVLESTNNTALADVMRHEIELLAKKNANRSTKPTKAQEENAEISAFVPTVLETGTWYRLSEIKDKVPALIGASGTQRIAVICNRLAEDGKLLKKVEKRVTFYALAD